MGTVVFTSPRTLRVLGLQKLLFPFIFRGNVPLSPYFSAGPENSGVTTNETQCRAVTAFRIKEFSRNMTAVGLFSHISTNFEFTSKTWAQNIKKIGDASISVFD